MEFRASHRYAHMSARKARPAADLIRGLNVNSALDLLEGSIIAREWIEHDPDMEPLRDHPRYQSILESLR